MHIDICNLFIFLVLLTCGEHLPDHIISLTWEIWANTTSLAPSPFIELPVPSQEHQRSCIYVHFPLLLWSFHLMLLFRQCGDFSCVVFTCDISRMSKQWFFTDNMKKKLKHLDYWWVSNKNTEKHGDQKHISDIALFSYSNDGISYYLCGCR